MNVVAASCCFPSGPGIVMADAALQSMQALHSPHPYFVDQTGNRSKVSRFLHPDTFGMERWEQLLHAALQDLQSQCTASLQNRWQRARTALWLVLPCVDRPGLPAGLSERMLHMCGAAAPIPTHGTFVVRGGHAAPITALAAARNALAAQQLDAALVIAVDTWLHPESLQYLDQHGCLFGANALGSGERLRRPPYGRIPSEGAAAVMLSSDVEGWCGVWGLGQADEEILFKDSRPCTGLGLTNAARQALQRLPADQRVACVLADLNGEPYRADQFGFTMLRLAPFMAEGWRQCTPALATGDLGCATALVHVALAAYAMGHRPAEAQLGPRLLLSSSDDALRGAVLLGALLNADLSIHRPV